MVRPPHRSYPTDIRRPRRPMSAVALAALAALVLAACDSRDPEPAPLLPADVAAPFPEGFLWGTATAGFQVDMGCPTTDCIDDQSDWYQWATDERIIDKGYTAGDPIEDGPGHWELYESDYDLARDVLHNNAYRLAVEWSRVFPTSTEGLETHAELVTVANMDAVAHYRAMLTALIERGMTPLVTLNHYTMPLWIHDGVACHFAAEPDDCANRGWLDPERTVPEIAKYAGFMARELGDLVDLWVTQNEPFAVVLAGYAFPTPAERVNPPGLADPSLGLAVRVIRAQIEAHARMYDAIHANDTVAARGSGRAAEVGIVLALSPFKPRNPNNPVDMAAIEQAHYVYNEIFLSTLVRGEWDENLDGTTDRIREDLKDRMDYVGINYYTRVTLIGTEEPFTDEIPAMRFIPDPTALWEYYPPGLYEMIMLVEERYGLPSYITETGTNEVGTELGPKFVVDHLLWVRQAIADGADVRGFFFWSLIDNYEWNHGYEMEFGLFDYDTRSKARSARPAAGVYGEIARENRVPESLVERIGSDWIPPANPAAVPAPAD